MWSWRRSIFSLIRKLKTGRPEYSLTPQPLRPITSHFCLTFAIANPGQPLLRCITVSLDSPHNLHTGDTSWPSIWCFIEFTRSAYSCAAHTIASVSFLGCTTFNHCHVVPVLIFSVSFRNLPWTVFPATDLSSSLLNVF